MSSTLEIFKLAELRVKTDRELVRIINNELELGLRLALIVESSTGDFDSTEPLLAEKAYAVALKLLPMVEDPSERRRLEQKLKQLREAQDRPCTPENRLRRRMQAGDFSVPQLESARSGLICAVLGLLRHSCCELVKKESFRTKSGVESSQ